MLALRRSERVGACAIRESLRLETEQVAAAPDGGIKWYPSLSRLV